MSAPVLNAERAARFMRDARLDALVVSSPVNVTYLTGYHNWSDALLRRHMVDPGAPSDPLPVFATWSPEHGAGLVVDALQAANAVELELGALTLVGAPSLEPVGRSAAPPELFRPIQRMLLDEARPEDPVDALACRLEDAGLDDGRLGLDAGGLSACQREALARRLPRAQLSDCANLLRLVRAVKSDEEVRRMAAVARLAEQAWLAAVERLAVGATIQHAIEAFRLAAAKDGAEYDHFVFGMHGLGAGSEPVHRITAEDVLMVDFGLNRDRYFSDTGTTVAARSLTTREKCIFGALRGALEDGAAAMHPGVRVSEVFWRMQHVVEEAGLRPTTLTGHGFGLELRDYPIVVADNGRRIRDDCIDAPSDLLLEERMIINLEANSFTPLGASLHSEQTFIVRSHGAELLCPQQRDRPLAVLTGA